MILVADSGSTKTAWCAVGAGTKEYFSTQGINPFQQSEEEICGVLREELMPQLRHALCDELQPQEQKRYVAESAGDDGGLTICFYGAGCTAEKAPVVESALRQVVCATARVSVASDMLGAARAVCGNRPGVVCILGTGSNSCHYDGRQLQSGIPALGYILGDEGSGAYIGRRLVGDVLKRQLPDDLCRLFIEETGQTQATIIQRVYREPLANRYLAGLSTFCASHRDDAAIHDLLVDCFVQFFKRNLHLQSYSGLAVHFVGSIAYHYKNELEEAARMCGHTLGNIVQAPLDGLVEYHTNQ